ncbi:MAG: IS66 family insertion sequence element accessory protein TnpB [Gammaproteobacteria bacterium]|nr:IS66 family insertion sequence element accessory protein TnpB [Gammaproteobacteria bacterium]
MDTKPRRARRNATEWQRLIEEQQRSGLSQETFCRHNDIGYGSFQNWKAKLAGGDRARSSISDFTELPPFASAPATHWDIELDLGLGIVLRVRRAS